MMYFSSIIGIFALAIAVIASKERIVNGKSNDILKTSYQVSILYNTEHQNCGGAILNDKIIITAAHCVLDKVPQNISVLVGTWFYVRGCQRVPVKAFRAHHDFQKESPRNDVALLLLSERLKFNSKVQSIELAAKTPKKGELAFASGFGNNSIDPRKNKRRFWRTFGC